MTAGRLKWLWAFGRLSHPEDDTNLPKIDGERWRYLVQAWGGPLRDQAFLLQCPIARARWIRHLFSVEIRWRLARASIIAAVAGLYLALGFAR